MSDRGKFEVWLDLHGDKFNQASCEGLSILGALVWQASRRAALEEAAEMCMRATPDAQMRRALGDAAHYVACANAIRALSKGETE